MMCSKTITVSSARHVKTPWTKRNGVTVMLYTGSNLVKIIGYPDTLFVIFLSSSRKMQDITSNLATTASLNINFHLRIH
jgi:hypothetical protein